MAEVISNSFIKPVENEGFWVPMFRIQVSWAGRQPLSDWSHTCKVRARTVGRLCECDHEENKFEDWKWEVRIRSCLTWNALKTSDSPFEFWANGIRH